MPDLLPPLLAFTPALMPRVWGSNRLREIYPDAALLGPAPHGEAWLISDHPQHESIVSGGPCDGMSLRQLTDEFGTRLLGDGVALARNGRFPLLLKYLVCNENLSVQVHPDDAAAARLGESDGGKTEAWYITRAEAGSKVYAGLAPGTVPEALCAAARHGDTEALLYCHPARAGEAYFIPAGTVHALGAGLELAEIQQNSDVTYRIDDWGRRGPDGKPRALHLDQAMACMDAAAQVKPINFQEATEDQRFVDCPYFKAERLALAGGRTQLVGRHCRIILNIAPHAVHVHAGNHTLVLPPFMAALLPACTGYAEIHGSGTCLSFGPQPAVR